MIVREYMAVCDICYESCPDWKTETAQQLKVAMKENGWKRIKGQDVCDECYRDIQPKRRKL